MENPVYLGDALYAYFDGHGIELRLNRHDAPCIVYLEPEVWNALINFALADKRVSSQPSTHTT